MAQAQLNIADDEKVIIAQHGFQVSANGNHYVVRDPLNKKLGGRGGRIESGNLLALLSQAVRERDEAGISGDGSIASGKAARGRKGRQASTPAQNGKARSSASKNDGDELNASEIDNTGGKVRKPAKPKALPRDPATLKTRAMIKHIIQNPEAKSEKIKELCEGDKLIVTVGTVNSVKAVVKQALTVLADIGWLKEEGQQDSV